ncbi:hypothetical protein HHL28_07635 [Aerophototrophica crusticola]|uniref:Cytochrome b561 bacterial/Ni-hydrogenase domain-containing protein n=1 Tax=Aerophototrophica crusticola TaxID=1709002 RepID=A0A858R6I9_9PROT|nr:hypothetical protein HHL28_07635 [Rhodospirillaceae bacterium B3]
MPKRRVTVWDLPTRVFHWGLVFCLAGSWYTSGDEDRLETHLLFGYGALALLLFRVVWGVVGSDTARFASFVKGPAAAWLHLRHLFGTKALEAHAGHNPLGAYAVLALLGLVAVQVGSGLFLSGGDIVLVEGPLSQYVDQRTEDWLETVHETAFILLQVMVAVHVLAIAFYGLFARRDLVGPMLTGRAEVEGAPPRLASPLKALLVALGAGGVVWALATLA